MPFNITISIPEEMKNFIKEKKISPSKFFQKKLQEKMDKEKENKKNDKK